MSALFSATALVVPFENLRMTDVESVGGKNASLGEMISQLPQGVRVPTGFATTAHAFRAFLAYDGLTERINAKLDALALADTNKMELRVFANTGANDGFHHAVLVARLDNLGKGASGAAVQNLKLMLSL